MLSLRSSSTFDLFDRIEQQLSQQLHSAERVPAAEVKATERSLLISAERRSQRQLPQPPAADATTDEPSSQASVRPEKPRGPLLSEFRYGTWSRSFRFPVPIEREQLQAVYRDGLLTVTAPKANKVSSVTVKVEG